MLSPSRNGALIFVLIAILLIVGYFSSTPADSIYGHHIGSPGASTKSSSTLSLASTRSKNAFATFLTTTDEAHEGQESAGKEVNEKFFLAVRTLAYQLLYAPDTKSRTNIPFIVLVTESVPAVKRERLSRDGAIVVEVQSVAADWIRPNRAEWNQALAKLRLWELTQFERIAFLDADTVLAKPLDALFDDPAVQLQRTNHEAAKDDASRNLPDTYAFAGTPELFWDHHFPPVEGDWPNINYLNAGFFVLKPDVKMLEYYKLILATPNSFDSQFPEQNLLNHAHRREGNVPWQRVDPTWNVHYPRKADLDGGAASMHEKWWTESPDRADIAPFLAKWRWQMEGFWEGRES